MNNSPCPPNSSHALKPTPASLNYSFGLPASTYCLATTRELVRKLLEAHGLAEMGDLGVLAASELLATACAFTPGRDAHLSMRWRYGTLRLTVFDEHPAHGAQAAAVCREQRRKALWVVEALVDNCGGICGVEEARAPLNGGKMWAVFPREAARNYARM
ncbi:ATP-binding protein [Streptomyces orinoci]|uniref:ATP-binding protein n=1 Tax=Streptomyces orinoci TaxID=67339 RepID=A0ABV3K5T0_STRON|nr:ATP-binding protein [Streptomyces orinoci]